MTRKPAAVRGEKEEEEGEDEEEEEKGGCGAAAEPTSPPPPPSPLLLLQREEGFVAEGGPCHYRQGQRCYRAPAASSARKFW